MNEDTKKTVKREVLHCAYCETDNKQVGEWHQDINLAYRDQNIHLSTNRDHDVKIMDKSKEE
jgi:hypothetical protein